MSWNTRLWTFCVERIGISEKDIITGSCNVPEIWYFDSENKKRRHYVDIYKIKWTLKLQEHVMEYKQIGAENQGYHYEIWIYDHKGNKLS